MREIIIPSPIRYPNYRLDHATAPPQQIILQPDGGQMPGDGFNASSKQQTTTKTTRPSK
jgi:hypothetical protein